MSSQYPLSPSVRAFFARDPIGRERFAKRARIQAKRRQQDEAVAPILAMNDGYFIHPNQPAPPAEPAKGVQIDFDFDGRDQ